MLKCSVDFLLLAKEFISYSGRGIFHKGHYQDCLADPQMKYSLIHPAVKGEVAVTYLGLCLPRTCSDKLITQSLNFALKTLKTPFTVGSIDSNTQNYQYPLNWVGYVTIFILTALILLVLAATVRYWREEKKGRNRWLGCFDAVSNIQQHFKVRESEDLNVWDGVRAFAMLWVVIGHSYTMSVIGSSNLLNIQPIFEKPFLLVLEAGIFSVDIFFSLGGFFLAFILLRSQITASTCALGILQRALRIWPAYIISMMFFYSLSMKTGSGVLWSMMEVNVQMCKTMQWDILFVSNFVNRGETQCMEWGWYLQVDFQLFVAGVFLLYLYSKSKKLFTGTVIGLSLASTIFIFVYMTIHKAKIAADIGEPSGPDVFDDTYIKPHTRCVPYLMGLLFGALFMEYRTQVKTQQKQRSSFLWKIRNYLQQHNKIRIMIEWSGIALMTFVTLIPRPVQTGSIWPQAVHSLYNALSKPLFILGVFLTVLPSVVGIHHSFFNLVLNAKILVIIARISFCTYLIHIFILTQFIYSRTYDTYYGMLDIFVQYQGMIVLCLFFGFLMTVIVEVPLGNMLKIGMARLKKTKKEHHPRTIKDSLITNDSLLLQHQEEVKAPYHSKSTQIGQ